MPVLAFPELTEASKSTLDAKRQAITEVIAYMLYPPSRDVEDRPSLMRARRRYCLVFAARRLVSIEKKARKDPKRRSIRRRLKLQRERFESLGGIDGLVRSPSFRFLTNQMLVKRWRDWTTVWFVVTTLLRQAEANRQGRCPPPGKQRAYWMAFKHKRDEYQLNRSKDALPKLVARYAPVAHLVTAAMRLVPKQAAITAVSLTKALTAKFEEFWANALYLQQYLAEFKAPRDTEYFIPEGEQYRLPEIPNIEARQPALDPLDEQEIAIAREYTAVGYVEYSSNREKKTAKPATATGPALE